MTKEKTLEKINLVGMLAVIRGPSADLTIKMVDALIAGNVTGIEITYTTPEAESIVSDLSKKYGDSILLGMGTLTSPSQAESAKKAGAKFLVSPVCEPNLIKAMVSTGLATMAGALTPTEVYQAYQLGTDIVKIFPGSLGGPTYLKSLKGPFPNIKMMPTGGVNISNIKEWFEAGAVAIGAGSDLCPPKLALAGDFAQITQIALSFSKLVQESRNTP